MESVNPDVGKFGAVAPDLDEARLRARIAEAISAGGGVREVSEKTGIPRGTLEKYAAGTATASFVNAAKIAAAAGVHLDQVAFSDRKIPKYGASARLKERLDAQPFLADLAGHEDLIRLPVFDVHASAGLGLPVGAEVQRGAVAFDPQFLRDRGARPDQCSIISASGDSMQPSIPDGSLLIVDHSQTEIRNGHIMVINVGDDLLVKRIRRRLDGLIDLISDNPAYLPETLGPDTLAQLRVVGRVVYFCRVP